MRAFSKDYESKVGVRLFPGTLNLEIDGEWSCPEDCMRLDGEEYAGKVTVLIVPCTLNDRPAFVFRTLANEQGSGDHPKSIIEVASDWNLRNEYALQDGDFAVLELPGEIDFP